MKIVTVTPLTWKALVNLTKAFHYLWLCPLEWDPLKKRLCFNKMSRKLIPWTVIILNLFAIILILLYFLLLQILSSYAFPLFNFILIMIYLVLATFTISFELVALFFSQSAVSTLNALIDVHDFLKKGELRFF